MRLVGAYIGGVLDLSFGKFRNPNGNAINAMGLRIDGGGIWRPDEVSGELNLAYARVVVWGDNATGRDTRTILHGFRYDALYPGPEARSSATVLRGFPSTRRPIPDEVAPKERIKWLGQDPAGYAQPYAQLAAIYRAEGRDPAAPAVLVASENWRRKSGPKGLRSWPRRAWGWLLWATVGYGYRLWLALLWLLALVTVGTFAISWRPDAELVQGDGAPPPNALLYTVDALLPFIDLGYSKWVPHGGALTATVPLVVLGWVLATAVVAAFAGVLRRGD